MSLIAMAFLWTGSQIPVYIFGTDNLTPFDIIGAELTRRLGAIPPLIYRYFNPTNYVHQSAS